MKKLDVGQAISILANLGVIAGIVFLGFEIRQNNELMRFDAEYLHFQNRVIGVRAVVEQEGLAEIFAKVEKNEALDDGERVRIGGYYGWLYRAMEWEHSQADSGFLERVPADRWAQIVRENEYAVEQWDWYSENVASSDFLEFFNRSVMSR